MRPHFIILQVLGCLLGLYLLAGCASDNPRSRYLESIEPGSVQNLTVYLGTTNLELRYPLRGQDAYAYANWPALHSLGSQIPYNYRYATLSFDSPRHGARRTLVRHGEKLAIRDAAQWRTLVNNVFQGLMPKEAGHGVLVLVQDQEVALYRDKTNQPHVVRLEEKPTDIIIDHALGQSDFIHAAIGLLESNASHIGPNQTHLLFVTDDDPAFVMIDLQAKLIVFLSYPGDPDAQPTDIPAWFTLKALNSIVVRGFVISAIKNPVTMLSRGLWHIGSSGAAAITSGSGGAAETQPPPLQQGPGMDLAAWEKHLDRVVSERRLKGKVDVLIDGDNYFPSLIKSIGNAKRSIDVLVYIFGRDDYAVTIANLLKHQSSAARVRVLMDELGSLFEKSSGPTATVSPNFKNPGDIKSYLTSNSKVKVRASTNPWFTSDHRKCIIIDSKEAYVGGMNIGRNYRYDWHDMMVRVSGPVVGWLEKDYEKAWAHAGWLGDFAYAWVCLFDQTHPRKNAVTNAIDVRPLRTGTARMEIYRAQLEAIRNAKSYIFIENAYFGDDLLLRELIKARYRGVDVRVIFPEKNDSGVMQTANLITANAMFSHGIRVYAYPGMSHVKAALYDGWACLGSANMEKMSLRVSQELDVAFSDSATVETLKTQLFEKDFKRAREITHPVPMDWVDFFVKAFAGQI